MANNQVNFVEYEVDEREIYQEIHNSKQLQL